MDKYKKIDSLINTTFLEADGYSTERQNEFVINFLDSSNFPHGLKRTNFINYLLCCLGTLNA